MTLQDVLNIAINTASGTPPYHIACSICQLRGVDPHGMAMVAPVQNWQAVIMEQILGGALVAVMQNG